jgi:tRNA (guanine37-N1)-methyltransferase
MLAEPLLRAVAAAQSRQRRALGQSGPVCLLSPAGRRLDHAAVCEMSKRQAMILVCGRYEGVDERFIKGAVDEEWSIGDFVVSGGELPAMCLIDATVRQIPGTLGSELSAAAESFCDGLLDYPQFTRPVELDGQTVPAVLTSGHHANIQRWRLQQSLGRTAERRPDLLGPRGLRPGEQELLDDFQRERFIGLVEE